MSLLIGACGEPTSEERVRRITYWEKWTGFEGEAADAMVVAFNKRQQEKAAKDPAYVPIQVDIAHVSKIHEKLLVATAGGNPPDIAGLYTFILYSYADKGALTDLTPFIQRDGLKREDYIPAIWDMCSHRGKMWALPTTPATTALHWNKRLFREAGLDPDKGPSTIEELDAFAEKLTVWEVTNSDGTKEQRRGYLPDVKPENKRLVSVGFLPSEPGWWPWGWGFHFGGELLSEDGKTITSADAGNVRAFEWVAKYSKHIGVDNIQRFKSGFGSFSSPQNAFMSGKVAMEVQGVWMYNFIESYSPGMEWGAAAFPPPADRPDLVNVSNVEADVIIIPKDSKHPDEAWEFIKFVNSQEGAEILAGGHGKFSPLAKESETFKREHKHPYIGLFRQLAYSPNGYSTPKVGMWNEYRRAISTAYDKVQNLRDLPKVVMEELQTDMQKSLDRNRRMLKRRGLDE